MPPPSLGRRGEGWVAIQSVLFLAIIAAGFARSSWPAGLTGTSWLAGRVLGVFGIGLAVSACIRLGPAFTPLPRPRDGGRFTAGGAYRLVRHPVYGGLVIASVGWGLSRQSLAAVFLALVLGGFFDLKSRREEVWLVARYPEYEAYRARVRHRLLPWLY